MKTAGAVRYVVLNGTMSELPILGSESQRRTSTGGWGSSCSFGWYKSNEYSNGARWMVAGSSFVLCLMTKSEPDVMMFQLILVWEKNALNDVKD